MVEPVGGGHSSRWQVPVEDSAGEEGWLITYLDVITLLLVMFVVMLALSGGPSATQSKEAASADSQTIPVSVLAGVSPLEGASPTALADHPDTVLAGLDTSALGDAIDVIRREGSISFRISNDILFPSGEGMLSGQGFDALQQLIPLLEQTRYHITVAGHTDTVPISTLRFPSNWELSSARAGSVVRYFIAKGIAPERMAAVGYAGTRPLADNSTEKGRARNRRVELILERDDRNRVMND